MAEGKNDAADDSDNERDDKAIHYPWNLDHVVAALDDHELVIRCPLH